MNLLETRGVSELSYVYPELCKRLEFTSIYVWKTEDGTWESEALGGKRVAGLTWCDLEVIELSKNTAPVYFHELAHLAQCPFQDDNHETWDELGIWETLARLKNAN